ncbi:methylated-DNA--[protein]-cysteine S-methyltransferase [Robertkochia flava]|uniref:methylated-DNA--[protein]-cysteine S-methyltransferase n=1 Tax=Robertkochia flava TaxID=3447986 RepID=UPI001CCA1EED|nr:methylated-DNA--[protein]-cysteine S-methyltransferase [Robertkochia marina]
MKKQQAIIDTPLGSAILEGCEKGVSGFRLTGKHAKPTSLPSCLEEAARQIHEYFRGERKTFTLNLNPEGTPFQQSVWQALTEIPFGSTLSYSHLSRSLGNMKAIRAVASANGRNPIWIIIPCHRVIGSDGSLTGYAGGLQVKQWLLEHEQPVKQQRLF